MKINKDLGLEKNINKNLRKEGYDMFVVHKGFIIIKFKFGQFNHQSQRKGNKVIIFIGKVHLGSSQ